MNKKKQKEYNKKWKEKNREKVLAYSRKYYKENKGKIDKQNKEWREKNRELWLKINLKSVINWKKNNPEKNKQFKREYYWRHRNEILEKAYNKRNKIVVSDLN